MTNTLDKLIINTGLKDNASFNVIMSTIGQLSDGIWENSKAAEAFWPYADVKMVNGEICLIIHKDFYCNSSYRGVANGFLTKYCLNPTMIKDYFAKKVKAVVNKDSKDHEYSNIKFSAKCNVPLNYMFDYGNSDNQILASDAYKVYTALKA